MEPRLKILVVEDNEDDYLLLQRQLTRAGIIADCLRVETEMQVQEAFSQGVWQLVLSDYSLPHFSGKDALVVVRKLDPDIPFIVISGQIGEEAAVAMMKAGANDYLMKGEVARLGPAIERELRDSDVRRQRREAQEKVRAYGERMVETLESISDVFISLDREMFLTYCNSAAERVLHMRRDEMLGSQLFEIAPQLRETRLEEQIIFVYADRRPRSCEIEYEVGVARQWFDARIYPQREGLSIYLQDVTERKVAEQRIQKINECFLHFTTNPQHNIDCMVKLLGSLLDADGAMYSRLEATRLHTVGEWKIDGSVHENGAREGLICIDLLQQASDEPMVLRGLADTKYAQTDPHVRLEQIQTYVGKVVRCGQERVGALCTVYRRDVVPSEVDMRLIGIIASAIGIEEERLRAQNALAASVQEKEVLLKEIHHRVKNNLQLVASLLNLHGSLTRDERTLLLVRESQQRLKSMGLIHETLYRTGDLARVDFRHYVKSLADAIMTAYRAESAPVRFRIDIEDVFIETDTAIPCALIINELLTNAIKHAFPGGRSGEVLVRFHHEGGRYRLCVQDNGVGIPQECDIDTADTLGLRLVRLLTQQIGADIQVSRDGGTMIELSFEILAAEDAIVFEKGGGVR